jgi:hypothetical protein
MRAILQAQSDCSVPPLRDQPAALVCRDLELLDRVAFRLQSPHPRGQGAPFFDIVRARLVRIGLLACLAQASRFFAESRRAGLHIDQHPRRRLGIADLNIRGGYGGRRSAMVCKSSGFSAAPSSFSRAQSSGEAFLIRDSSVVAPRERVKTRPVSFCAANPSGAPVTPPAWKECHFRRVDEA